MSASFIMRVTGCSVDRDSKTKQNKALLVAFDNILSSLFHENVKVKPVTLIIRKDDILGEISVAF